MPLLPGPQHMTSQPYLAPVHHGATSMLFRAADADCTPCPLAQSARALSDPARVDANLSVGINLPRLKHDDLGDRC